MEEIKEIKEKIKEYDIRILNIRMKVARKQGLVTMRPSPRDAASFSHNLEWDPELAEASNLESLKRALLKDLAWAHRRAIAGVRGEDSDPWGFSGPTLRAVPTSVLLAEGQRLYRGGIPHIDLDTLFEKEENNSFEVELDKGEGGEKEEEEEKEEAEEGEEKEKEEVEDEEEEKEYEFY